jgi:hypothetical protein
LDWTPPTSVFVVRSFLGLAGYYRRFILNISKIAKLIMELLMKGNKYVCSDACDEAFKNLTSPSPLMSIVMLLALVWEVS